MFQDASVTLQDALGCFCNVPRRFCDASDWLRMLQDVLGCFYDASVMLQDAPRYFCDASGGLGMLQDTLGCSRMLRNVSGGLKMLPKNLQDARGCFKKLEDASRCLRLS